MPNRNVADDASNPNKATIADNDAFLMRDSESGPNSLKEVLWSLLKSTLNLVTNGNSHDHNGGDGAQIPTGGIADDAVDNTKLANMAVNTVKGRVTAGTGSPEDMTAAQARSVILSDFNAFSAYRSSAQTIGNGSLTKVQFDTEEFDTGGFYDNATNYRFLPTVAGKYQFNACVTFPTASGIMIAALYKNGTRFKDGNTMVNTPSGVSSVVSALVDLNGSTDYVEIFTYQNSGGNLDVTGVARATYFQASLQR
jgi:hypothetical protein